VRGEVGPGSDGSWDGLRSVSRLFSIQCYGAAGIIRSWAALISPSRHPAWRCRLAGGMERPTSSGSVSVSFLCFPCPDTFIPFGIFFALVPSDAVISI
jgi:hypothetical protein